MSAASSRERAPARSWRATARVPIPGVPAIVAGVGALALLAPKPSLALAAFAALSAVAALLAHFGGLFPATVGGESLKGKREVMGGAGVGLQSKCELLCDVGAGAGIISVAGEVIPDDVERGVGEG